MIVLRTTWKGVACAAALFSALIAGPALAQGSPGEGKTIRFVSSDSLGANYIQDQILIAGLEKLGYEVKLSTMNMSAILQAISQGDLDMTGDINWPQAQPAIEKVAGATELISDGTIIGGGINGYMIDKKTAEANNITNFSQLKDPKIAALFDSDGDGKANLINCDPAWKCGDVVDFQVKEFGLSDTVRPIRAKYEPLIAEAFARADRGEPILLYTWSPSWIVYRLKPAKDVVWLPIPYDALPPGVNKPKTHEVPDVAGCAGGQNPCRMAVGPWNWRTLANKEFLAANPAVGKFVAQAKWPLNTWSEWEGALGKGAKTNADMKKIASEWIAANQGEFDRWISAATK
ncbi:glycine betaine/L-proline ABC transporter substrate-binding protein ProX [Labrys sp. ZIDIC5]|uniref:glycine betaine/L-proline ABC transporter substrate-binding protein ProX n=1 Tax=Labrys sedimenti TaxID=3106036 RepID=UPI002ACA2D5C|nr:glycine betaine/L-proline ABC transporter substrate-binding protein ProX [Labrys sp. ZIDIC5]MDZ5453779.1 glycine betaine/L-proline ABC transporter substrate-binding protein ProX [Labrys sp. ZIDIC5]